MDVDLMMNYQVDEANDNDKWLAFNLAQGARMSAMEHLVPEQMFSTDENPAHGVSAVKALQLAAAEGQKIWTITAANVNSAVTNLILPQDIVTEIRNSAAAGKTVTVHERPIDFYGSSQIGYVILDPETGAGAYKIGGGENGGELRSPFQALIEFLIFVAFLAAFVALISSGVFIAIAGGGFIPLLLGTLSFLSWSLGMGSASNSREYMNNASIASLGFIFSWIASIARGIMAMDLFIFSSVAAVVLDLIGVCQARDCDKAPSNG